MMEIKREEVNLSIAARAMFDTLDGSEDENYISCSKETMDLIQVNCQEESDRINPTDFIPVPSAEFRRICQIVMDGDTIERQIKTIFFWQCMVLGIVSNKFTLRSVHLESGASTAICSNLVKGMLIGKGLTRTVLPPCSTSMLERSTRQPRPLWQQSMKFIQ